MIPVSQVLFTVAEAAERLRLSQAAIYEMVRRGQLPAVRVGPRKGAIRIRASDLDQCLEPVPIEAQVAKARPRPAKIKLRHIRI